MRESFDKVKTPDESPAFSIVQISALNRTGGQTFDHVLLAEGEQAHGGNQGQDSAGSHFAPLDVVLQNQGVQTDGHGLESVQIGRASCRERV